ncbi:hypothetical protein SISNIDRAFT_457813 [Sistotremastrum niveocremeum HHB9708]|uniref:Protein YOP1 n=2 Tax=Sistotremastraceae TaxID=3402574 RepID=A0A164R6B2_9AGAM|nr:hypothetical protein SISNIDRAFT_457813 [Sistotremastrum niveocremeum HHB9708]KZT42818.1 hypothetical protein SISSUDRAFT_1041072 [Sistotremastrum suecicum HHB10207 ss-3]
MSQPQSTAQKVQNHPAVVQAQNTANQYVNQLDKHLGQYPALIEFEKRTQVPKTWAAIGTVILFSVLILINPLASPISNLVGFAAPAYLSFRAIESPGVQDDVQWLSYWSVFSFFNLLESFALRLILYYLPFYYPFKTVFILWLQLPAFRGAQTLYFAVLKPVIANAAKQTTSATSTSTSTATADDLRSRVHTATADPTL